MNIFENKEVFLTALATDRLAGTTLPLLRLVKQIGTTLGEENWMLGQYMVIYFKALQQVTAKYINKPKKKNHDTLFLCYPDMLENKFEADLRRVLESMKSYVYGNSFKARYSKSFDRFYLLCMLISDDYQVYCTDDIAQEQARELFNQMDEKKFQKLYDDISQKIGHALMDELNHELKRRFMIAPVAFQFAQETSNQMVFDLVSADFESYKMALSLYLYMK